MIPLTMSKGYLIADMAALPGQDCPCGETRRAFLDGDNDVASLHVVDIKEDAQTHYHKRLTEIYYILDGEGVLELDGEEVSVRPHMAVLIKPRTRHRARGKLRVINIPIPAFDPEDEYFD